MSVKRTELCTYDYRTYRNLLVRLWKYVPLVRESLLWDVGDACSFLSHRFLPIQSPRALVIMAFAQQFRQDFYCCSTAIDHNSNKDVKGCRQQYVDSDTSFGRWEVPSINVADNNKS
jgi:hypothetical protein